MSEDTDGRGMRDLTGRLALVTGGGKGVGKVIARRLAERGADVLINCFHSYGEAKRTQAELEAIGARAEILRASVAKKDQVDRMFDEIEERYGYLDILVNNAASGSLGPSSEITVELFAKTLDTNLLGSFLCSARAAALMQRRGGGAIVNISSVGAGMVPDNYLMVGTSKAAVEALTRHLAAEYAPLGIRVNTASCGLIRGDVAELFPRAKEMQEVVVASTPLGRLATAEDLAGVVMFLTSDLAQWVTGQVVLADGGLSLVNAMLSPPKELPAGRAAGAVAPPPVPLRAVATPAADDAAVATPAADDAAAPEPADDPVAVVGMGLAVPGANSPEEFWQLLTTGAELFVETPPDRWNASTFFAADAAAEDKAYQTRSGFITGFEPDPGLAAEIAAGAVGAEYTTRWLRHSLHQALRGVRRAAGDRFAFAVGYTADGSQHLEEATVLAGATRTFADAAAAVPDPQVRDAAVAAFRKALEARLSRGTGDAAEYFPHQVARNAMAGLLPEATQVFVVDTACSSSLYTIDLGMRSLLLGDCDVAVCGGAFALGPRGAVLFSRLHGLSTGGAVRSLDRGADGVLFSDGAGVVVLKRLSRALADGDRVLGVLRGCGSSSDGRGKAIYAPSTAGQQLAVRRALEAADVEPADLQWVVAHATGTPAGDVAEFATLRETLPADHAAYVTSNKALIGHTGWAAGVVSLIEVLLSFRHSAIAPQHRFAEAPAAFEIETTSITIPKERVQLGREPGARARIASISGFGFGGTNAHLVVAEHDGRIPPPGNVAGAPAPERIAIVGWSAHLPGLDDADAVAEWLRGGDVRPARSFGREYALPAHRKLRIPPSARRILDRGQLMFVECMFQLADRFGGFFDEHAATTGVLAGHMGPTGHAARYALRCYLDDLRLALDEASGRDGTASAVYEAYAEQVRAAVPPATEDAFPGIMPNIIPARVASTFDFHGLNMTVDTGFASTLAAVDVAGRYLRSGALDVALVGGVNGSSSAETAALLGERLGDRDVAEGAFMFVLVRESTARDEGLPILAYVADAPTNTTVEPVVIRCGEVAADRPSYLGAEGAVALLDALLRDAPATTVRCVEGRREAASLTLLRGDHGLEPRPSTGLDRSPLVTRHRVALVNEPGRRVREPVQFWHEGALVLTDEPAAAHAFPSTRNLTILSTASFDGPLTADAVRRALAGVPHPTRHVRVLADLSSRTDITDAADADLRGLLALHDLLFLVLQERLGELDHDDASILACLLGGVADGEAAPVAGLFTGLLKSATFELPRALVCTTVTSSRDALEAAAQANAESALARLLPVAVYDGGERKVLGLERAEPEPAADEAHLGEGSVVLACGGSRGIAAEALKALARRYRPTLYVLGSNDVDLSHERDAAPLDRAEYLRREMRAPGGASLQALNRAFDRLADARLARENLEEMRAANGGRVTYLRCDARDADQVAAAVRRVIAAEGRVDVVINAAGINRSGVIRGKRLEDFQAVRDLKVSAYRNLRRALADQSTLWCNFSSYIGLKGQIGESDYAAANDFVATASVFASRVERRREFAIGWNLWSDVGLGAAPLMKSFLAKRVRYTRMSTEEGIDHFLREFEQRSHDPWSVFLGDAEVDHLGFVPPAAPERPAPTPARPYYLDATLTQDERNGSFERVFSVERDPYLAHHVVNGTPTLPGTFALELAAEAAAELVPGRVPARFENVVFSSFLRVPPGRPVRKRVLASVVGETADETLVSVRVLTDVTAPDGRILVADKLHFSCIVRMRAHMPAAPRWVLPELAADAVATADPYHVPNPAVHLTGPFVTTRDLWVHRDGCRAAYAPTVDPADPTFGSFLLPVLLLDGLLRVSVPDQAPEIPRVLAVPSTIRRLDVYTRSNDCALAAGPATIDLSSVPPTGARDARAVASFADGRVVAQIEGMSAVVVGSLTESGELVLPERAASLPRARVAGGARR